MPDRWPAPSIRGHGEGNGNQIRTLPAGLREWLSSRNAWYGENLWQ